MFVFHGELVDYSFVKAQQRDSDHCVLFLHGWGGNKNSFYSTKNLLSAKYNCLTLTLPTTAPTNLVWCMEDYVDCVENLLASLNIKKISIVCHSFGFRIATLLNYKITNNNKNLQIEKIVVTGGAGAKKINIFKKINKNNNICLLKKEKNKFLFEKLASEDYKNLTATNKKTFQNVVNFNTINMLKFNCNILLFWGKEDRETPIWIARKIFKNNKKNARLYVTKSNHFAYLKQNAIFNNLVVKFL